MALTVAIVDASALVAAADQSEPFHGRCIEALRWPGLVFVVPALIVAAAAHLVGRRLGADAEAAFITGLLQFDIFAPGRDDLRRMADLIRRYANFPLGAADASVVALAERYRTDTIITLDRAVRPVHTESFRLLPD